VRAREAADAVQEYLLTRWRFGRSRLGTRGGRGAVGPTRFEILEN